MNLIEALRQANGNPVARKEWGKSGCTVSVGKEKIVWGNHATYGMYCDDLLADDWYVVEPKSKIEEAIEREVKVFWNNEKAETMYSMDTKSMLRRVVNLALDEAADTLQSLADDGYVAKAVFEISKLKVKE